MSDYTPKKQLTFDGTKKISPCKNCKTRHEGCHSSCEDYLAWKAENDKVHADILKKKREYSDAAGHKVITITRTTGKKPKAY